MELVAVVLLLVTVTYAINILKIRMVVSVRPVAAAALEGAQSFLYVYVLVRLLESANTGPGMVAYVAGASLGTLAATLVRTDAGVGGPGHSHACCSGRGEPISPSARKATAPRSARASARGAVKGTRPLRWALTFSGRVQRESSLCRGDLGPRRETRSSMDWLLWLVAFGLTAVPVGGLLLDRLFDVPARRYFAVLGLPWLTAFAATVAYAQLSGSPVAALLLWGAVGGMLGTIALDAVRLAGVRAGAFPLDMPRLFGVLLAGLAPSLQRNLIARMVEVTATLPDDARRRALVRRVAAMARLTERRRSIVAAGMLAGLARLPEELRQAMLQTQLALLAEAPAESRQAVMWTMTRAMSGTLQVPYGQPRGMPKIPMADFRALAEVALARAVEDSGAGWRRILILGYGWHFLMGATFGAQYTLLAGPGSLPLAVAWGVFVWLAMMVVMPPMMPMIRFPAWFPVVPFLAHVAFAAPLAWVALTFLPASSSSGSLLGLVRAVGG